MKSLLFICTAVAVALGAPNADISDRIAGGSDADISNFPYIAQLEYNDELVCGAIIVASNIAMTAGQCVVSRYVENFMVRAGTSTLYEGGQEILISTIVFHPQYDSKTNNYGVALLILSESVANAQPISLATTDDAIVEGANVLVAGWGWQEFVYYTEFSTTLQSIQLPIIGDEQCKSAYVFDIVSDVMFCAAYLEGEGQGFCWGDAGGPAVIDGVLVGMMSFGKGCGDGTNPGVLIRASKVRDWVEEIIESYQAK